MSREMNWPPEVDHYMATIQGLPAKISVDLGARPLAPVGSLPVRLMVRVVMKNPREDGLQSDEEQSSLAHLEHTLKGSVEGIGLRQVGRIIYQGFTDLVYYCPPAGDPQTLHGAIMGARGDYELRVAMEHDADWSMYLEFLYPTDPRAIQAMKNRRIFQRLVVAGDDPKTPRLVNHTASFGSILEAVAVQQTIRELGFQGPHVEQAGEDRWELVFSRDEVLAGGRMDTLCAQLIDVITEGGGTYEGWGTMAMSREEAGEE